METCSWTPICHVFFFQENGGWYIIQWPLNWSYIYHKNQLTIHVGRYTSPMDGIGNGNHWPYNEAVIHFLCLVEAIFRYHEVATKRRFRKETAKPLNNLLTTPTAVGQNSDLRTLRQKDRDVVRYNAKKKRRLPDPDTQCMVYIYLHLVNVYGKCR